MNTTIRKTTGAVFVVFYLAVTSSTIAADAVNPRQPEIDAMNHTRAFVEAETALLKANIDAAKQKFPGLGDSSGKSGELSFDTAGRDKFHVSARTAEAYQSAAKELAKILLDEQEACVLLTDADRNSVPVFLNESTRLMRIFLELRELVEIPVVQEGSVAASIVGAGSLLTELAQITRLFRSDKAVSFTDADLPDELLTDLIAVEAKNKVIYPNAYLDSLLDGSYSTNFGQSLKKVLDRRNDLRKVTGVNKVKAETLMAEITQWSLQLTNADAITRAPMLLTILRGEVVTEAMKRAGGRTLNVKVLAEGGTSLKTSNIWRSDKLYASGGVVISYRVAKGGLAPSITKAGVISSETPFQLIPLK